MNPYAKSLVVLSALLTLASAAPSFAADREREKLLATQKTLSNRIEVLKNEQDFLLFEKAALSQDSKYVVVNVRANKGQLRYKQRVLRDFSFLSQSGRLARLKQGVLPLTLKVEGQRRKNGMVFGNSLFVVPKGGDPGGQKGLARMVLTRSDFRAIFSALENGAQLYILP